MSDNGNLSPAIIVEVLRCGVTVRGRRLAVPRREFEVVLAIALSGGFASRRLLGSLIWGAKTPEVAARYAKVYVCRLRQRFGQDSDLLGTSTAGYYFAEKSALDIDLLERRELYHLATAIDFACARAIDSQERSRVYAALIPRLTALSDAVYQIDRA